MVCIWYSAFSKCGTRVGFSERTSHLIVSIKLEGACRYLYFCLHTYFNSFVVN